LVKKEDLLALAAVPAAVAAPAAEAAPAADVAPAAEAAPAAPEAPAALEAPAAEAAPALVKCKMTELPVAIDAARAANLTPLISDRSKNNLLDTFHRYKADLLLDCKALSLKVAKKETTLEEGQETLRAKLSSSFHYGHDLVLSCQSASPSFSQNLCHELFPVEIFKDSGASCRSNEFAEKVITDEEVENMPAKMKMVNEKFKIMVTTHFKVEDLDDFFFGEGFGFEKMPKTWFQIISIEHDEGTDLLD
jgi:hypothetical protein